MKTAVLKTRVHSVPRSSDFGTPAETGTSSLEAVGRTSDPACVAVEQMAQPRSSSGGGGHCCSATCGKKVRQASGTVPWSAPTVCTWPKDKSNCIASANSAKHRIPTLCLRWCTPQAPTQRKRYYTAAPHNDRRRWVLTSAHLLNSCGHLFCGFTADLIRRCPVLELTAASIGRAPGASTKIEGRPNRRHRALSARDN